MTALDDALNSSSVVFAPHDLTADWLEQYPSENTDGNPDSVREMGQQLTGEFTVTHSLDDGLPDPVTMTSGNEASGVVTGLKLNGRESVGAQTSAWGATNGGTGTGTSIVATFPAGWAPGDYILTCLTVNSTTPVVNATIPAAEALWPWRLLADVADGTGLRTLVWGREAWGSASPLTIGLSVSAAYSWATTAVFARTADGTRVPMRPGTVVAVPETPSVTAHTNTATLARRGYLVGVWALVAGTAQWTTTDTELTERVATVDMMVSTTAAVLDAGTYTITGTSTSATAVATKIAIPMEIADRPRMDAVQYFSPFNPASPVYGFSRDTAKTALTVNVLTATGPSGTVVHRGQMADIGVSGRQAEMSAVSKTRLDIDAALTLPRVPGFREGLTIDWVAAWIAARAGQFPGPAPTPETVAWLPMYGSIHNFIEMPQAPDGISFGNFMYGTQWDAQDDDYPYTPYSIPGPFHVGMFACQTATNLKKLAGVMAIPSSPVQMGSVTLLMKDQMSQANTKGRVSFWIKGDAHQNNPTYLPGIDAPPGDNQVNYQLYTTDSAGGNYGSVQVRIDSDTRMIWVTMGANPQGFPTGQFTSCGALPSDGLWHFIAVSWDWANGLVTAQLDGTVSTNNTIWTGIGLNTAQLPPTTAQGWASGWQVYNGISFGLPASEFKVEAGTYYTTNTDLYPTPTAPGSFGATMRPTYQKLVALYDSVPSSGWNTIASLAQSSLVAYRTNEMDNLEFLPQSYFGETAQMTPVTVYDTNVNASELDVRLDPSKTRNVVTVEFQDTSVSTNVSPVLSVTEVLTIPLGQSFFTFTLDTPAAAIYLEGNPGPDASGGWTLYNMTAVEIAAGIPSTQPHFMTANSKVDGTGTVRNSEQVSARIMSADANSVTVRFRNAMGLPQYIVNNGNNLPFLVVRGNPITSVTGYATATDSSSVGIRRQRALSSQLEWVQDRDTAKIVALKLANTLSQPRAEVGITVMGDPRRKPGSLVTIADSEGTQAAGTWRILSVQHNLDGPMYTQDLHLYRVLPISVWDGPDGWDNAVWGA